MCPLEPNFLHKWKTPENLIMMLVWLLLISGFYKPVFNDIYIYILTFVNSSELYTCDETKSAAVFCVEINNILISYYCE